jgi:DNA-binding LytR/AlgR family response regulator
MSTTIIKITRNQSIETNAILFLEAHGNYTLLYLSSGKQVMAAASLKSFENILPKTNFCRPSKSFIICKEYIKSINYQLKHLVLNNKRVIQISRRRVPTIFDEINTHSLNQN